MAEFETFIHIHLPGPTTTPKDDGTTTTSKDNGTTTTSKDDGTTTTLKDGKNYDNFQTPSFCAIIVSLMMLLMI